MEEKQKHTSVLLNETVTGLSLKKGTTVVDATVGTGGHAEKIAESIGEKGTVLAIDADSASLERSQKRLTDSPAKIIFVQGNFRNLKKIAHEAGIESAEGIVFDLGWHAEQLASGKGLSFNADEPLLMTLSLPAGITAKDIIANWEEEDIATLLREYGEERFAGRIARVIVESRRRHSIETSKQLADVVSSAVPTFYRRGRIHPATRTFQALRIAVNDELNALTEGLADALSLLSSGGRIAVISFHSLEDRIVKQIFRKAEDEHRGRRITKKPIVPTSEERAKNPRARSAKLRIFEKNNDS
ncbi:16S rRNA (cytosine(1402)-N(4))-methyltransferase [Candidatus Kaiserbacteria bacterium RIFCSPHIGHO2_01_FULL_48_10]|uniref:Ribosomal RNA small subunit methyltransferase H n=1 Tax=Candidatus Kaiserbacteria bacterium RIFCSPHIGHO2_01_FULL_48_10 TaxID=1798476 RepID=A0A1F6C5W3_9BACT|nr:MAG: 16S rRNA (cytosine(1402)-N(4))-methyltransferase [Candidatus Kaiserbacteria bacterium RIFCSPHIGHO2_01_FULL_48_10]